MNKKVISKLKGGKEIEAVLIILISFGILSMHLWLFWIAFWTLFFLRFKHFVKILSKFESSV